MVACPPFIRSCRSSDNRRFALVLFIYFGAYVFLSNVSFLFGMGMSLSEKGSLKSSIAKSVARYSWDDPSECSRRNLVLFG